MSPVEVSPAAIETERAAIADRCRDVAARGVAIGGAGNISVRVGEKILITRGGLRFEQAGPDDICVLSLDGELIDGARRSSETMLHVGIYQRSDAQAIVHTHGRSTVAVGLVKDELPMIHYYIRRLGGRVPTVPYHVFGSHDLAGVVGEAVAAGSASVLMRNHGSVSCGATLEEATEFTEMTEWLCQTYIDAQSLGEPAVLTGEDLAEVAEQAARITTGKPSLR